MNKIILSLLILMAAVSAAAQNPISNAEKLRRAQQIIEGFYVEDVDGDTLVTEAIRAMLKTLDPHSAYTTAAETREFTEPLDGHFSGIGIQFNMLEDTVYVIQPTAGGPSERVGIMPGDRIVSVNDTVIAGKSLSDKKVKSSLRGPKGSLARLKVKRGEDLIDFDVIRDDIPVYSVDETFMADPQTGYIRVTRFADDTANEVALAIDKLKRQGMKNLIIDLGDNTGGYLRAAFDMAAQFLPAGTRVVSTAGRHMPSQVYATEGQGNFQDGRVVVITNQYSASASEIFAGAMQDNDRALIVGRRTFGKGLVQRPFTFPDGSMIRLTTSRYYTPSGRCIQKHYEPGHSEDYQREILLRYSAGELWSADSIARPDSLRYQTLRNGRTVYGGGGIIPDVFVPVDTSYYSTYYRNLVAKGMLNRTAISYVDANRRNLLRQYRNADAFHRNFTVSDNLLQSLIDRGNAAEISYDSVGWERSKPIIEAALKGLIARDLYEDGSYFRSVSHLNKDFNAALDLINNPARYEAILRGEPDPELESEPESSENNR